MKIPEMHQLLRRSSNVFCLVFVLFIYITINSCVPAKKFVYFHNLQKDTLHPGEIVVTGVTPYVEPKILVNDILSITIQTLEKNPGNAPVEATSTASSNLLSGFLVDKNGYVELSLIGFVKVAGLTTSEARELIKQKVKEYYKEPVVNVQIANFDVTVMGDVGRPGVVNIQGEKATVLDVLARSGDLTITGRRNNVLLTRTEGDQVKFVRLDLTNSSIYTSPYLYVRQRDYLYVEPNNFKRQTSNNLIVRYMGLGTGLIAVVSLLFALKIIK